MAMTLKRAQRIALRADAAVGRVRKLREVPKCCRTCKYLHAPLDGDGRKRIMPSAMYQCTFNIQDVLRLVPRSFSLLTQISPGHPWVYPHWGADCPQWLDNRVQDWHRQDK